MFGNRFTVSGKMLQESYLQDRLIDFSFDKWRQMIIYWKESSSPLRLNPRLEATKPDCRGRP
jgi:hypothetical protein